MMKNTRLCVEGRNNKWNKSTHNNKQHMNGYISSDSIYKKISQLQILKYEKVCVCIYL